MPFADHPSASRYIDCVVVRPEPLPPRYGIYDCALRRRTGDMLRSLPAALREVERLNRIHAWRSARQ